MTYTELAYGVIDKARDLTVEGMPFSESLATVLGNILWDIEGLLPLYCSEDIHRDVLNTDEFKDKYMEIVHRFLNTPQSGK